MAPHPDLRSPPLRGFTLMEIMAVIAIMGIILLAIIPNIDGQVPKYRLRGGARAIGSSIELCQSETIARRKTFVLVYDLDRNTYDLLLPEEDEEDAEEEDEDLEGGDPGVGDEKQGGRPADDLEHGTPPPNPDASEGEDDEEDEDEESDAEFSARDGLGLEYLPEDVVFKLVVVGEEEHRTGKVYVAFSDLGNDGAHYVGLTMRSEPGSGARPMEMWIKFSPLTRTIQYTLQRPEIRTLSASESDE